MKQIINAIIALAILAAIIVVATRCKPDTDDGIAPPVTDITTPINAEDVPATVYVVAGTPHKPEHEVARMDTTLVSNTQATKVDLGIEYDEYDNTFDLDATIVERPVVAKPKFITPTASLTFGYRQFNDAIPERLGIGAGVKIMDKYSIQITADTDKTYGITLGMDL
jgi:hypothetical protein